MPFIGWSRSTIGVAYGCPRDRLGWPLEKEWRPRGCSWEWCRVPGREREGAGRAHAGHRRGASIGRAGQRSGASCRRERRAREQVGGLLAWSGRRGASTSARGKLEVVGRRGVNGRVSCRALQSATLAGIRGFPASVHVHYCLEAAGCVGKSGSEPWMLWKAERRGVG